MKFKRSTLLPFDIYTLRYFVRRKKVTQASRRRERQNPLSFCRYHLFCHFLLFSPQLILISFIPHSLLVLTCLISFSSNKKKWNITRRCRVILRLRRRNPCPAVVKSVAPTAMKFTQSADLYRSSCALVVDWLKRLKELMRLLSFFIQSYLFSFDLITD